MRKICFVAMVIMLLNYASFSATLSLDWSVGDYAQPTGYDVNSSAYDPVSKQLINSNYGADLSLEIYNKDNGSFVSSSKLSGATFGSLGGFGIGASAAGSIYLSDSTTLYKIDNISDTTVVKVNGSYGFENPCRNISIQGAGIDTYLAVTGSSDNGPIQIWKSDNAECSSFSPFKTITGASLTPLGAAKSGCAISPVIGSNPPEWVAGGEVFGAQYMRLFKYNSETAGYDHKTTIGGAADNKYPCFDMAFDFTEGYIPLVAVLTTSGHADPNIPTLNGFNVEAAVDIFNLNTSDGSLSFVGSYDLTNDLNKIGNRGSIEIDSENKKIYVAFRCEGGTNHVAMARLSYTLDPIGMTPTPSPTPVHSPTPTATPTPSPIPTQTPSVFIIDGYEKPPKGLRWKEVIVSPSHGLLWNTSTLQWGWQRPLIQGEREDLITPMFCNRWLMPYFQNAGAMTFSARERDEQTSEVITNYNIISDVDSYTGNWTVYSEGSPYGSSALMTESTGTTQTLSTIRFNIAVQKTGNYCLYIWYPTHPNASEAVPYIITDGAGNKHNFIINQTQKTSRWNYLSSFYFEVGSGFNFVEITSADPQAGKTILADAVRIGGGMGDTDWGGGISGVPRWHESSQTWAKYMGAPSWVWDLSGLTTSDYVVRSNYRTWQSPGNLQFEIHSNASAGSGTASGSYAIIYGADETDKNNLNQMYLKMGAFMQQDWDPTWLRRTPDLYVDTFWGPMYLLEIAFHDNITKDLIYLMDPDFRHITARSLYCASVDYFTNNKGVYLPEAPYAPYVINIGNGKIRAGWKPPIFGSEPTKYRVYHSLHPNSFVDFQTTDSMGLNIELSLEADKIYYFQFRSENDGGVSLPTETLAAKVSSSDTSILIVNGFDRLDWKVQEWENTRDFVIQHTTAIADAETTIGKTFAISSASNEAIINGSVSLGQFNVVDWILGEESRRYDITYGKGYTDDKVFSSAEQEKIKAFLNGHGNLFISGSDIAWDIDTKGETSDKEFLIDYLLCRYEADDAESYNIKGTDKFFVGLEFKIDDGTNEIYNADAPDTILAENSSTEVLKFSPSNKTAGIIHVGNNYHLVLFSFPFETIVGKDKRSAVMKNILYTLLPNLAPVEKVNLWEIY